MAIVRRAGTATFGEPSIGGGSLRENLKFRSARIKKTKPAERFVRPGFTTRDDHPLAAERNIPFERLAQEPFLIREDGSGARRTVLRVFGQHGLTPRIRMELGTNEAIREAILAGLGITIMSRHTFGLDPESSRYLCLDVEGFPLENHWYLVYPVGRQLSSVARAFLDFARVEAKGLVMDSLGQAR
jgi:DNA-binding transcriptional LysR family regulator